MADDYLVYRDAPQDAGAFETRSRRIVEGLLAGGVNHVVGLPDNQSRLIFEMLSKHDHLRVVPICREGEAFALASGLYAGGATPAAVIQNTGLLESGDSLRGTAWEMGVPLVSVVGYRGFGSLGTKSVDSVATLTEDTLKAWRIPYRIMGDNQETEVLTWAFERAGSESRPVVALMP